jgi:hypothetical protein
LLQYGAETDISTISGGYTPLFLAQIGGHTAIINLLRFAGDAPLHLAARKGLYDEVKSLLLANADIDPNIKNKNRDTPLHIAAYYGHEKVVHLLLMLKTIDTDAINQWGNTPCMTRQVKATVK